MSNIDQINKVFKELEGRIKVNKKLMTAIAGHMHASVMNNFETEGRSVPGGWPKKMFPGKALQGNGNLIRSIQASATESTAQVYTNRRGAALQHYGGEVKGKKILGSVSRKKDVFAMEQLFWRYWYQGGKKDNKYKYLALHVHKHGSVMIPARPFMVITDKYKDLIIDEINKHVVSGN